MPQKSPWPRRIVVGSLALAVLAGATVFSSWYFSFEKRYERSRGALNAYAAQVMAIDPNLPVNPPARLGAFDTSEGGRLPGGFYIRCNYGNSLDWNGLAFSNEPLPAEMKDPQPPFARMYFQHIEGGWYKLFRN